MSSYQNELIRTAKRNKWTLTYIAVVATLSLLLLIFDLLT